ncbi:hypothetical protein KDH_00680 [Dictyobacter sp. S3.2.2.5]|uniref:Uncharacterized protein n=1 Tax=Dictyobacter halimunensis TaxID=3026934 RepID=A0ABQ6FGX2_9CHLR|nr:hypothetical protein KDH_00680 [Dictyobacter sp. S3.2.2.5]
MLSQIWLMAKEIGIRAVATRNESVSLLYSANVLYITSNGTLEGGPFDVLSVNSDRLKRMRCWVKQNRSHVILRIFSQHLACTSRQIQPDKASRVRMARIFEIEGVVARSEVKNATGKGVIKPPCDHGLPLLVLRLTHDERKAPIRKCYQATTYLRLRINTPGDDIPRIAHNQLQCTGGHVKLVDVMTSRVVFVHRYQDVIGGVRDRGEETHLYTIKRRQISYHTSLQVHSVQMPVLIATLILEIQEMHVVCYPEVVPHPSIGVARHGVAFPLSNGLYPDIHHVVYGSQIGHSCSIKGNLWIGFARMT